MMCQRLTRQHPILLSPLLIVLFITDLMNVLPLQTAMQTRPFLSKYSLSVSSLYIIYMYLKYLQWRKMQCGLPETHIKKPLYITDTSLIRIIFSCPKRVCIDVFHCIQPQLLLMACVTQRAWCFLAALNYVSFQFWLCRIHTQFGANKLVHVQFSGMQPQVFHVGLKRECMEFCSDTVNLIYNSRFVNVL